MQNKKQKMTQGHDDGHDVDVVQWMFVAVTYLKRLEKVGLK